jgi:hypothetical protein
MYILKKIPAMGVMKEQSFGTIGEAKAATPHESPDLWIIFWQRGTYSDPEMICWRDSRHPVWIHS